MFINEIMSVNVETIAPTKTLRQAGRIMCQKGIGSLPVVHNEKLIGVITDRDISCFAVAMGRDPNTTEVQKAMSKNVVICYDDQDISYAAYLMQSQNVRRLVVLGTGGNITGLISLDDLARGSYALAGTVLGASKTTH